MPASPKQFNKVGFSPEQAAILTKLWDDASEPSRKELMTAGFTKAQADVLRSGTPSPDGGLTPTVKPSLRDLLVLGRFTRAQAKLILA